jgi:folate-binding protein YgfZ
MVDSLSASGAVHAALPNRGVLRLSGPDRVAFLQGLVSNDVTAVAPSRAVYACLLTAQGKFLHDFFLISDGESLLIECEADRRDDLIRKLKIYKLRSKVEIVDLGDAFSVFAIFGDGAASILAGGPDPGEARPFLNGIVYDDPRLPALGSRILLPKAGGGTALAALGFSPVAFETYDRLRIVNAVPDGSRDMEVGKAILLESNIDLLGGISWDKGCYMGQELTARTHYRGLIKKRLVPMRIAGPTPALGELLIENAKDIGEMRSSAGDLGLALVRLDALRGERPIRAGDAALTPEPPPHLAAILAEPSEA